MATLLCSTAGIVNAAGFLSFNVLTTNVTGHAALLARELARGELRAVRMVGLWLVLFLAGAFFSGVCIRLAGSNKTYTYTVPIVLEFIVLVLVASLGNTYDGSIVKTEYFAGSLLFAMGLQNALVSAVSGSVVRTTHLTGMFTDLGIDLALIIRADESNKKIVRKRIILRVVIVSFFILGGILGAFLFLEWKYQAFFSAAAILMITMFYDAFRVKLKRMIYRRSRSKFSKPKAV